jgi:hypothetical protein
MTAAAAGLAGSMLAAPASAATQHHWMTGQGPLASLASQYPATAGSVFNRAGSFVIGNPPAGYATTRVTDYKSYATYVTTPAASHWVLYDPESWSYTPTAEKQNPGVYMRKFATLAHQRGQQVILTPARDLVLVSGAACTEQSGESLDHAYLRCQIPRQASAAGGDVVEVQAQGDQLNTSAYAALVAGAKTQIGGTPVWAGLTTDRGDPVSAMVNCYNAVSSTVQGFWLNTSVSAINVANKFLTSVRP